ncbi:MAG TPA: DUF2892 domain-containing protein [Puia sp.]|nr:DUF2892 domain-containing protein [Puia sp.]
MKKNMGLTDKAIRLTLALIFIVLFFAQIVTGTAGIVLMLIAIIFMITSLVSFCPIYKFFGINTTKKERFN